jgi:PIN domain nuclease of toxin-antitoxin system
MTYVLDTHALYWHLFEPAKLSPGARQSIAEGEAGEAGLIVLALVLAELYYLLVKFQVDDLFPDVLASVQSNPNYRIESIILEDIRNLAA